MKASSSRFVSVWLRNGWSSKSPPVASSSARSTSALKMTRPGSRHEELAAPRVLDRILVADRARLESELDVLLGPEALEALPPECLRGLLRAHLLQVVLAVGEEVRPEHHVLARRRERPSARGREDVVRREHEDACLRLRLGAEGKVHGHLVAVEVGVERLADERMHLDGLALDEHRLERLDAQAVERRARGSRAPDARR